MFEKKALTPISREAILRRIAEIDHKFKQPTHGYIQC